MAVYCTAEVHFVSFTVFRLRGFRCHIFSNIAICWMIVHWQLHRYCTNLCFKLLCGL